MQRINLSGQKIYIDHGDIYARSADEISLRGDAGVADAACLYFYSTRYIPKVRVVRQIGCLDNSLRQNQLQSGNGGGNGNKQGEDAPGAWSNHSRIVCISLFGGLRCCRLLRIPLLNPSNSALDAS